MCLDLFIQLVKYRADHTLRYPVHTNPKNNQSFMYMNLAISLVTDLGLDRETPNPSAFNDFDLSGLYTKEGDYSLAAKQAYLGTYYLSSAYYLSS
jgi:hypothetical protein